MGHSDNYAMSDAADFARYGRNTEGRPFFIRGWMDERAGRMVARIENPEHSAAYYQGYFAARGTPRPDAQKPTFIFAHKPNAPGQPMFGRKAIAA